MATPIDLDAFAATLRDFCAKWGILADEEAVSRCKRHLELLQRWNRVMNLVGDLSLQTAVERHYGEGLYLATFLPEGVGNVADIGSGGGFPGAPVAAMRREASMVLIESRTKKATFLRESTRDWGNVAVFCGLAADYKGSVDWICSRGVAGDYLFGPAQEHGASLLLLAGSGDVARLEESCRGIGQETESWELPWRPQASVVLSTPPKRDA